MLFMLIKHADMPHRDSAFDGSHNGPVEGLNQPEHCRCEAARVKTVLHTEYLAKVGLNTCKGTSLILEVSMSAVIKQKSNPILVL